MKLANLNLQQLNEDDGPSDAGYETEQDILYALLPHLQNEINKLNRRAKKLGTPPIEMHVSAPFYKTVDKDNDIKEKFVTVEIDGEAPHVPGYDFLATIEHKDGGNIIRTLPGVDESNVKQFYNAKPEYCDHCKKVRRRIDTYIVKDQKTGNLRQIGRNCLADFLGGKDPKRVLFWFSLKQRIEDIFSNADSYEGRLRGRAEYATSHDSVLRVAAALVRKYGYKKSSGNYGYNPDNTASDVKTVIFSTDSRDPHVKELRKVVEEDREGAEEYKKKALDWFNNELSDDEKQNNNYFHSIDVILQSSDVGYRDVGLLASIFPAYDRAMGKKKALKQKDNSWVGDVGDKLPITKIKVSGSHYTMGNWGELQIVKMEDDKGRSYTWFNSSSRDMERDAFYEITGRIKKHDEYRGRKTTVLTHVKAREV
jgi:hypothetical protein